MPKHKNVLIYLTILKFAVIQFLRSDISKKSSLFFLNLCVGSFVLCVCFFYWVDLSALPTVSPKLNLPRCHHLKYIIYLFWIAHCLYNGGHSISRFPEYLGWLEMFCLVLLDFILSCWLKKAINLYLVMRAFLQIYSKWEKTV